MKTITETEFLKNYKKYESEAQINPVAITCNEDIHLVLISSAAYAEFERSRDQKLHIPPKSNR